MNLRKAQVVMRTDKLLVLAFFLLAVGGAAVYKLLGNAGGKEESVKPAERRPLIPTAPREFLGISLPLHSGWEGHPYERFVREIAAAGADTICITVFGYQENASSTSIFIDVRKTPSEKRLKDIITYCRRDDPQTGKGPLKVVLMPIVLLENQRGDEWRGTIAPTNWDHWWRRYTNFLLYYAKIAQETDVDVFVIGSELLSTESEERRWKNLIEKVRSTYKGRLCYSANWDHYGAIGWWKYLDIIGMTTYHDLTGGKEPTLARLKESWRGLKEKILTWRKKNYPNLRILFTEVGWPNQVTCAQYPWNYYAAKDKPAPEAQANCFEAFFSTWMDEPAVAGYLVWEWRSHPGQAAGPEDTSYVPCGKPAEEVISRHLRAAREKKRIAEGTAGR